MGGGAVAGRWNAHVGRSRESERAKKTPQRRESVGGDEDEDLAGNKTTER